MKSLDYGLVSIITPSFNSSAYIEDTINSIINQTYQHWELLITDDCSTDHTCHIIQKYVLKDNRIKLFKTNNNSGAGICRNISINHAKGDYIAFCDSDDRWLPEKLEKQLTFMNNENISFCYSSYYTCSEEGIINGIVKCKKKISKSKIKRNNYIGCLTSIYNSKKLGKFLMPELRKRQDWGLWIRILKECQIAKGVQEPLAIYRLRNNSISSNKLTLIKYNLAIYQNILNYRKGKALLYLLLVFLPSYIIQKLENKINRKL